MATPLVTVAFYTHNRPEYLSVAISSVLQQSVPAHEILIVDDGSGPETRQTIEAIQAQLPGRIRYIWQEQQGRPTARNRIIQESTGTHILWIGDDDAILPTTIETHLAILNDKPDTDIIYGRVVNCDENLTPLNRMDSHRLDGANRLHLFFKHNPVPDPGTLVSKKCYERIGGYNLKFKRGQDYDFYARAASANASFEFNDSDVCLYRSHTGNQATPEQLKKGAQYRIWVVEDFISRHDLEDIFPHHPWHTDAEKAFFESIMEIVCLFSRIGGHDTAIEALAMITQPQYTELSDFATNLVTAARDQGLDGILSLQSSPLFNQPHMAQLRERLLIFLCTAEERQIFNQKLARAQQQSFQRQHSAAQPQSELAVNPQEDQLISMSAPLLAEAAGILAGTETPNVTDGKKSARHQTITLLPNNKATQGIKISVIVPTYNRPELVANAVESICNQPGGPFEVIVVNDAGKDIAEETLQNFSKLPIPVTVVKHCENQGLGASRNTGAAHASGEWLMVLDDDDILVPGGPHLLLEKAEQTAAEFVCGDHIRRYFEGETRVREEYHRQHRGFYELLCLENRIPCGTFIVKRSLFERLNGYREDLRVHEDYNLHIRIAQSTTIEHISSPIFIYNIRLDISRMNLDLRPYWFATAALNHQIARGVENSERLKQEQRYIQYEHLAKALKQGTAPEKLVALVKIWWDALAQLGVSREIGLEVPIIESLAPELVPGLNGYQAPPPQSQPRAGLRISPA